MTTSPNLSLPYIDANQSQKHVTHNSALQLLDAVVALSVIDDTLTAPPSTPSDGHRHIVATGATGAWAGQDGKVAAWLAGAWAFLPPKTGWRAWVASRSVAVVYTSSAWQTEPSLEGFRNRLRNASFAINQRVVSGTVTLAAGAYGHDGLRAGSSGATYTFATSGIDTTITLSAGSLIMPIEGSLIEGGAYVLANDGSAQARLWQGTGYTGSGSYAACARPSPLVVTGLAAGTQTNVEFSSGTILRSQFEPGVYATPFERRQQAVELSICQRYFYKSFGSSVAPAQNIGRHGAWEGPQLTGASGAIALVSYKYPVQMRTLPTVTLYNPIANNGQIANVSRGTDWSSSGVDGGGGGDWGPNLYGTTPPGSVLGDTYSVHLTASAEL